MKEILLIIFSLEELNLIILQFNIFLKISIIFIILFSIIFFISYFIYNKNEKSRRIHF